MSYLPRGTTVASRRQLSRRQLLGLSTAATTALLAGCLDDDSDDGDETGEPSDGTDDPDNGTDDGSSETNGDGEDSQVPDSFDDRDELRDHSQTFLELVATGDYERATEWFDPELGRQVGPETLEDLWHSFVGVEQEPDAYRTVTFFATEMGNNLYLVWAEFDGNEYQFTITYSVDGVLGFQITPVEEWVAPAYVDESAIETESVVLDTPECELDGELTLPAAADGPVPGVVLVHGNGPQDRDAVTGPNRPFKELAWGLASNGIATLRYDKRTFACEIDLADVTIDDVGTEDALTGIERLREHERIAADEIFIGGFSFGGLLTPRIAERDGRVAGTIMLAPGPTRSFATTIEDQMEHLFDVQNVFGPQRDEAMAAVAEEGEKIRSLDIGEDEVIRYGGREYYETLQAYDHETTAAELDVPQLLLQGENDWQVTVEDDLPSWENAIGDREDVTITVYDDLNHLFQESEPPLTQAEYTEPESPVDGRVIEDIAAFITERTGEATVSRPLLVE